MSQPTSNINHSNIRQGNLPIKANDFIGIRFIKDDTDGVVEYTFPLGYGANALVDDKRVKKEILNLISIIKRYNKTDERDRFHSINDPVDYFPIHAYIKIINMYLSSGYYKESEVQYHNDTKGKINWKKTIKNIRPIIQDDSPIFTEFVVRNNRFNTDNIIT